MILMPCSGGVVAIGPPVVEGRIVAVAAPGAGAPPGHTGTMETVTALDDALTVFAATAPRYGSLGLANHGPMAAEASRSWARPTPSPDGWSGTGVASTPAPPPAAPPAGGGGVAGRPRRRSRFPDWLALFEREVADRPPVRGRGRMGAPPVAGHGRCGDPRPHPHRARRARPARPPTRRPGGSRWRPGSPSGLRAIRSCPARRCSSGTRAWPRRWPICPTCPRTRRAEVLISDMVAHVADIADEFEQAVASLGWAGGAVELLDQLASGGALAYLRNADGGGAIGLLHAVTVAARLRAVAAVAGRGGPRRRRSATSGRPWRRCTSPTTSTGTTPVAGAGAEPSAEDARRSRPRLGRRARHKADRGGAAQPSGAAAIPPSCGRRPTPAPASAAERRAAGRRRQARG